MKIENYKEVFLKLIFFALERFRKKRFLLRGN